MKYDDTDNCELDLAALQRYESMQATDVDEVTHDAHRQWLKSPVNAAAYRRTEQIFALVRTLADSPELTFFSEETNKRLASRMNRQKKGYAQHIPETQQPPNGTVEIQSERSK